MSPVAPAIFLLRGFRGSPDGERNPNPLSRLSEELISLVNRATYETRRNTAWTTPHRSSSRFRRKFLTISGKSDPSTRCSPRRGVSAVLLRAMDPANRVLHSRMARQLACYSHLCAIGVCVEESKVPSLERALARRDMTVPSGQSSKVAIS